MCRAAGAVSSSVCLALSCVHVQGCCCCLFQRLLYDLLICACAGLLVQSFTQDGRFPTYCPGGTQPDPEYRYTVDKYSTVNVEEITINSGPLLVLRR